MCGISGIISVTTSFPVVEIKNMTDIISHRGPDDEGFLVLANLESIPVCFGGKTTPDNVYSSELDYKPTIPIQRKELNKAQIAFGHRRLSIIDISPSGHQPMCYANSRFWIVLNGEIYNYLELKEELKYLGYQFSSNSDTEVVLAAFQQWGIECQNRFNGMWAFAIYDMLKKEIFISRDRYGIKPLYYWFDPDGRFCFASEIKQFTTLSGWKAILNNQRASDFLIYAIQDHTDETLFKGVYQIKPGNYCHINIRNIKCDSTGRINTLSHNSLVYKGYSGTMSEASKHFNNLFRDSVKLHLRSDVPVGTSLSGGLDSSAIVCTVNDILSKENKSANQNTFSSCSIDQKYSEKPWMDIVVDSTDALPNFIYPHGKDVFKLSDKILWHQDEPYPSQSIFLSYHIYKAAQEKNIPVLLSGQGADEYLSCPVKFKKLHILNLLKKLRFKRIWTENEGTFQYKINLIFNSLLLIIPFNTQRYLSWVRPNYNQVDKLINKKVLKTSGRHPFHLIPFNDRTVFEICLKQLLHSPLQKHLKWEDRNSMAHSIESRIPFLDYRLVEFALQLPLEFIYSKDNPKNMIFRSFEDILPEKILNRKDKKGFISPEEKWVKVDFRNEFRNELLDSIKSSKGIISNEALEYFDKLINNTVPFDYTYWRLIQFGKWIKMYNVSIE